MRHVLGYFRQISSQSLTMHRSIEEKRGEIALLCERYGVRRLEIFGSAARGSDFDPASSDADFLVEFQPGSGIGPLKAFFDLRTDLTNALGRPVDLVEAGAVRNPYVLQNINGGRELIYAS
jgi:uncharacterized protein